LDFSAVEHNWVTAQHGSVGGVTRAGEVCVVACAVLDLPGRDVLLTFGLIQHFRVTSRPGEIWLVELGEPVGREQAGFAPP